MASDSQGLREMFVQGTGAGNLVKFGEITWVSNYRYAFHNRFVFGTMFTPSLFHRPNIRMVDSFGKGRVWLAGGENIAHSERFGV